MPSPLPCWLSPWRSWREPSSLGTGTPPSPPPHLGMLGWGSGSCGWGRSPQLGDGKREETAGKDILAQPSLSLVPVEPWRPGPSPPSPLAPMSLPRMSPSALTVPRIVLSLSPLQGALADPLEEQGQSQGPRPAGSTGMAAHPGLQCPGALPRLQPGTPRTLRQSDLDGESGGEVPGTLTIPPTLPPWL